MRRTIGSILERRELALATRNRIIARLRRFAVRQCYEKRVNSHEAVADELVQDALRARLPDSIDDEDLEGLVAYALGAIENRAISAGRRTWLKNARETHIADNDDIDKIYLFRGSIWAREAEDLLINREESREKLAKYIRECEREISRMEVVVGRRRKDVRKRILAVFAKLRANPDRYIRFPDHPHNITVGIRIHQLASDLGITDTACQHFVDRLEEFLIEEGLHLDRMLLGLIIPSETKRMGITLPHRECGRWGHRK